MSPTHTYCQLCWSNLIILPPCNHALQYMHACVQSCFSFECNVNLIRPWQDTSGERYRFRYTLVTWIIYSVWHTTMNTVLTGKQYKGSSINVNIFTSVQTIHFLRPLPPPPQKKEYTSTLSAKKTHENNKSGQKVKSVWKKCWFSQTKNVYGLYTHENVDIYGRPLIVIEAIGSLYYDIPFHLNIHMAI